MNISVKHLSNGFNLSVRLEGGRLYRPAQQWGTSTWSSTMPVTSFTLPGCRWPGRERRQCRQREKFRGRLETVEAHNRCLTKCMSQFFFYSAKVRGSARNDQILEEYKYSTKVRDRDA